MMSKSYGEHRAQTPTPTTTLTERPEEARFHLQVSVETETAAAAIPLLKRAAQRLEELLPPLGAHLKVTDFDVPADEGKTGGGRARLHATLTLPFAREASFWDRAQKLAQVDDLLRAVMHEGKKQRPVLEVRRDLPVFVVLEPEQRRAALIATLHARARSLGTEASLQALRFDRPVQQRSLNLEEVEVWLDLEGTAEVTLK